MNAYVAIGIAVAGWVATHILTLRAQRKTLRLQVLDRARNEITRELRAAQAWCGKVVTMVMIAATNLEFESRGAGVDWKYQAQQALELLRTSPADWLMRLEEYEILFPETAAVRERLAGRQRAIFERVSKSSGDLSSSAFGLNSLQDRQALFHQGETWLADVHDQSALLEDLVVHLQNEALSAITDRRIPTRIPRDPKLPKIVKGQDGLLWIEPDSQQRLTLHKDS